MPEEVLFETERRQSRTESATYLRTVADRLEDGDSLTLRAGDEELTLEVPSQVDFEVKAERETGNGTEYSVEFELEWEAGADSEDSTLEIE